MDIQGRATIETKLGYLAEAQNVGSAWRRESWNDCMMYDGRQWTQEDWDDSKSKGIDPLTINRTFPTINLLIGQQTLNRLDIIARGRTQKDIESQNIMTECVKFVMDQYEGQYLINQACKDALIPGIGFLMVAVNPDPRQERVRITHIPWNEMWWDPYASPWLNYNNCRYALRERWVDLDEVQAMFPKFKEDLEDAFYTYMGAADRSAYSDDWSTSREEEINSLASGGWAIAGDRRRIRIVQMFYTVIDTASFAVYPDGHAIELTDSMELQEKYFHLQNCSYATQPCPIRKMRSSLFVGALELTDRESPFRHNHYPYIPFIGYTDRYNFPYGVPRQIRDMDIEINKRRSMALAMLKSKGAIFEEGAIGGGQDGIEDVNDELHALDPMIELVPGALIQKKFQLIDHSNMNQYQLQLLNESKGEIQEITGANDERVGQESNATSGIAIERRANRGALLTAELEANRRRSIRRTGYHIVAGVQQEWKTQKVLRVTDRNTQATRYVTVNEEVPSKVRPGVYVIRNDITQGKYDTVVTESPATETMRERYLSMIMDVVEKSPPQAIPQLMMVFFELSDLPNREELIAKLKPLFGIDPEEEEMSPDQIKQKALEVLRQQRAMMARKAQMEDVAAQLKLKGMELENMELAAKIEKIRSGIGLDEVKADTARSKVEIEGVKTGLDISDRLLRPQLPQVSTERKALAHTTQRPVEGVEQQQAM